MLSVENGVESKSAFNVNSDVIQPVNKSVDMCVLGHGVYPGDGSYTYAQIDIELVTDNELKYIRIMSRVILVLLHALGIILLLTISCVLMYKRGRSTPLSPTEETATVNIQPAEPMQETHGVPTRHTDTSHAVNADTA